MAESANERGEHSGKVSGKGVEGKPCHKIRKPVSGRGILGLRTVMYSLKHVRDHTSSTGSRVNPLAVQRCRAGANAHAKGPERLPKLITSGA